VFIEDVSTRDQQPENKKQPAPACEVSRCGPSLYRSKDRYQRLPTGNDRGKLKIKKKIAADGQAREQSEGESFPASCVGEHLECSPCGKVAVSCVSTLGCKGAGAGGAAVALAVQSTVYLTSKIGLYQNALFLGNISRLFLSPSRRRLQAFFRLACSSS
jgi:hypothetical protein